MVGRYSSLIQNSFENSSKSSPSDFDVERLYGGKSHSSGRKSHSSEHKSKSEGRKSKSDGRKAKNDDGLKPPTNKSRILEPSDTSQQSSGPSTFDKTQWEHTRFAADESNALFTPSPMVHVPEVTGAGPVLGEHRQVMEVRGEHLLKRPYSMMAFMGVEMAIAITSLAVWLTADNPGLPRWLSAVNLFLLFATVAGTMVVEGMRVNVKYVEEANVQRYMIPYRWKLLIFCSHLLRFFLTCANITIMALDNDFDPNSIACLALQPFIIILCIGYMGYALRPRPKQ